LGEVMLVLPMPMFEDFGLQVNAVIDCGRDPHSYEKVSA
jgi:hypothetical protein